MWRAAIIAGLAATAAAVPLLYLWRSERRHETGLLERLTGRKGGRAEGAVRSREAAQMAQEEVD